MNMPHVGTAAHQFDTSQDHSSASPTFLTNSFTCYHDHDSLTARSDFLNQTCFYFVVFLRNHPPLFRSNKIPPELLCGDQNSLHRNHASPGDVPPGDQTNSVASPEGASGGESSTAHTASFPPLRNALSSSTACPFKRDEGGRTPRPTRACPHCTTYWRQAYCAGPRCSRRVGDFTSDCRCFGEVPQQILQTVAFPSAFGDNARGARPPPPLASSSVLLFEADCGDPAQEEGGASSSPSSMRAAEKGGGASIDHTQVLWGETLGAVGGGGGGGAPGGASREGPPWSLRVEEVRTAKGALRYYRIILCTTFAALVASHTGLMHSLQTLQTAVALVLMCPPEGAHFRFLLNHFDILRSMLHRTLGFSMRLVYLFFSDFLSNTNGSSKREKHDVARATTKALEKSEEAVAMYHQLKKELDNALGITCPLHSLGLSGFQNFGTTVNAKHGVPFLLDCLLARVGNLSGGERANPNLLSPPRISIAEGMQAALKHVRAFGKGFLSAMVTVLIALGVKTKGSGAGNTNTAYGGDPYSAYWAFLRTTTQEEGTTPRPPPQRAKEREGEGEGDYQLSERPIPRVVIFTRNAKLARSLMFIAAFFLRTEGASCVLPGDRMSRSPFLACDDDNAWVEEMREIYSCAMAAQTRSYMFASVPIQWVSKEFEESCLSSLTSAYSLDNDVVVVAPDRLLCYRLRYTKALERTTIIIEQGADGVVCLRGAANGTEPFRCILEEKSVVEADPVISALLDEALRLHEGSNGYITSISILESILCWLHQQGAAYQQHCALFALTEQALPLGGLPSCSEEVDEAHEVVEAVSGFPTQGMGPVPHLHSISPSPHRPTRPLSIDHGGGSSSRTSCTNRPGQTLEGLLLPGSLTESASGYAESLRTSSGLVFSVTSPSGRRDQDTAFSSPSAWGRDGGLLRSLYSAPSLFPMQKYRLRREGDKGRDFLNQDAYASQFHRLISETRLE